MLESVRLCVAKRTVFLIDIHYHTKSFEIFNLANPIVSLDINNTPLKGDTMIVIFYENKAFEVPLEHVKEITSAEFMEKSSLWSEDILFCLMF